MQNRIEVCDLINNLNKAIVEVIGEDTELDFSAIEEIIKKSKKVTTLLDSIVDSLSVDSSINGEELDAYGKYMSTATADVLDTYILKSGVVVDYPMIEETPTVDGPMDDSVRLYLKDIGRYALLTPEQEYEMTTRLKSLDPESEEYKELFKSIIESNLRLVVSIAKRYLGSGLEFLDLISEGNIGLMKALEKFEPQKGFKFSTYATWWVRQAMTRSIADKGRIIRVPVHMYEQIRKYLAFNSKFTNENGRRPYAEEVMKALNVTKEKLKELEKASQDVVSLETPIGEEEHGEQTTLADFIESCTSNFADEVVDSMVMKQMLEIMKERLTEKEMDIVLRRSGYVTGSPETLEVIGARYNVTRERIRQIEAKAYRKLRSNPKMKTLGNSMK